MSTSSTLFQENQRLNRQVLEMRRELKAPRLSPQREPQRSEPRRRESKVFGKAVTWGKPWGAATKSYRPSVGIERTLWIFMVDDDQI